MLLFLPMTHRSNFQVPDRLGHFGPHGGMYVPQTLMSVLQ
jgi:hypothetical protein